MKTSHAVAMVAAAVLITAAIQESRIAALRSELKRPISNGTSAAAELQETPAAATASRAEPATPVRTKSQGDARPEKPAKDPDPQADDDSFASTARKMWDNPAGKAMMNQGVKMAVSMMYEDFIKGLSLTTEESDYFKSLLGREIADQQELGMKILNASAEERKKIMEQQVKRGKETEQEIRKFLNNDEDFKKYTTYKNQLPERQQLDGIRATMNGKGLTLDAETETRLVDAMYRARTTAQVPDLSGPGAMEAMAKGNMVEIFEKTWATQQKTLQKEASKVLDEPRMAAFLEYQKQAREMQLMSIKMAEQMMKSQK